MPEQEITVELLDPLFSALDDPNEGVNLKVIEALSRVLTLDISSEAKAVTAEKLNTKLRNGDSESRLPVALVLADAGNLEAMPELLTHLSDPDPLRRLEVAKRLALLADASSADVIREAFQRETDPSVRSWLALALAHAGITSEIEQMFRASEFCALEARRVDRYNDVRDWLLDKLFSPFPEQAIECFRRISQEIDSDIVDALVAQLSRVKIDTNEISKDKKPTSLLSVDYEVDEAVDEAISVLNKIRIGIPIERIYVQYRVIPFLPSAIARYVVTNAFWDSVHLRKEYDFPDIDFFENFFVDTIYDLGSSFEPDIEGLFACYRAMFRKWGPSTRGGVLGPRIAWTATRKGFRQVLITVGPKLQAEDEIDRMATASLLAEAALQMHYSAPPIVGSGNGGTEGPEPIVPPGPNKDIALGEIASKTLEEAARFTDLTLYEGHHLYPGDDAAKSRQLPDNEALCAGCQYTLGVAIRRKRSGVDSATKAPFAVLNPRQMKETLTIFVVVRNPVGPVIIDEPVATLRWPYNEDSDSAFFRITVPATLPARESPAVVEVSLYHENLDLLDVVNLEFSLIADLGAEARPSRIDWPRTSKAAQPRLDPDAAVRVLNVSVAPATDGYRLDFLFERERGEAIKVPFETYLKLGDLENLLTKVRDFWTGLAIGIYADQLSVARSNWDESLDRLRKLGAEAWKLLFGIRTGSQKGASETLGDLLARMELAAGTHVQIRYISRLEDFVFPWCILYPPREISITVDPLQFWGARYQIEQVREGASENLLDSEPVGITVVMGPGFGETKLETEMFEHFRVASSDRLIIRTPISDRAGLLKALADAPPSHLYYFFCHGYTPAGPSILRRDGVKTLRENLERLAPSERKTWESLLSLTAKMADEPWIFTGSTEITESELRRETIFSNEPGHRGRRPIIFLNMCHSAALLPSMTTGFVRLFLDRDAAAVIGTESPMTSVFAHAFARELLGHLFRGSDLGTALWQARRHFLADEIRNPLGLAYTLYGRATVTLGSGPPLICAQSV